MPRITNSEKELKLSEIRDLARNTSMSQADIAKQVKCSLRMVSEVCKKVRTTKQTKLPLPLPLPLPKKKYPFPEGTLPDDVISPKEPPKNVNMFKYIYTVITGESTTNLRKSYMKKVMLEAISNW